MAVASTYYRVTLVAMTALAALVPLSVVLYQSFLNAPLTAAGTQLGLEAYRSVFGDEDFAVAVGTTLLLSSCMTLIAVPLGSVLAFLMVRTDLPARAWLEPVILIPVVVSTLVLAFGYVFAIGPSGILTTWFKAGTGLQAWNLHSLSIIVVIAGLLHVPYVYVYAATELRGLDSAHEEVARASGARPWKVALDVSLPMATPAIFFAGVLVFFLGFELFGLPLVLGSPDGVLVLTTYLFKLPGKAMLPPYQLMAVVAAIMVAIAMPLVLMLRILLREPQRYVWSHSNAKPAAPLKLGHWRWPAFVAVALWLGAAVLVPLGGLILRSFAGTDGEGVALWKSLSLGHYRELLQHPDIVRSVVNTLEIGLIGGAAAVIFYAAVTLAIRRWRSRWTRAVDVLITVARAMPGLVAGLAILLTLLFFKPIASLRHTLISVWLGYAVVWLATGMRLVSTALLKFSPELQDAARSMGASSARVHLDVTLPLIRTGILASWLVILLIFVREYATAVFLLGPGTEVVGSLLVSLWGAGATDLVAALAVINVGMIGLGLLVAGGLGVRLHG